MRGAVVGDLHRGVSCTYATLWNAFKRVTSGASAAEKAALYRETARRVYRLDG